MRLLGEATLCCITNLGNMFFREMFERNFTFGVNSKRIDCPSNPDPARLKDEQDFRINIEYTGNFYLRSKTVAALPQKLRILRVIRWSLTQNSFSNYNI